MGSRATAGRKLRRAALAVAVCVAALLALTPAPARAGRYSVAQCDRSNRAYPDAIFERQFAGDYAFAFRCEEDEDANSLQIHSLTGAPSNRYGRISWAAPPGAALVGVNVEARMRNDMGHQARLSWLDAAGNEAGRIATGSDEPGGFSTFDRQLGDGGRARFAASLNCVRSDGCRYSDQARNWIRSVKLTVEDRAAPGVSISGGLTAAGWHRGVQAFDVAAFDFGGGLRAVDVRVNGTQVAPSLTLPCATIAGSSVASRMQPCESWRQLPASIDTRAAPVVNGDNQIVACAADFGSSPNLSCARASFAVDNAPPELAFAAQQDPEDPELIRASAVDRHSGLAAGTIAYRPAEGGAWRELPTQSGGGELRARVDSSAEPPGLYVFRVGATDVAGNAAVTSARAGGGEMMLRFPIREGTELEASLAGAKRSRAAYGHRPSLDATLRSATGEPLEGQPLDVVETFAPGSSLAPVSRTVRTDERGRIDVLLTRGPSRRSATAAAAGTCPLRTGRSASPSRETRACGRCRATCGPAARCSSAARSGPTEPRCRTASWSSSR
jgi:hypothetical protein